MTDWIFNPPPEWPPPPEGWRPGPDWQPDPSWPSAPAGWQFWVAAQEQDLDTPTGSVDAEDAVNQPEPLSDDDFDVDVEETPDVDEGVADDVEVPGSGGDGELGMVESTTSVDDNNLVSDTSDLAGESAAAPPQQEPAHRSDFPSSGGSASDLHDLEEQIAQRRRELVELDDALLLQQVGIYEYHHPLENADEYKERLKAQRDRIKDTVRGQRAIDSSDRFAYNNSLAQGRKMTRDFSKLMLRAYNAEADSCVRSLRAGSIQSALQRLDRCMDTVARLGAMMELAVSPEYHALRVEELEMTSDYLFKVQEERQAAREERARLREERRAEQELAAERERLDKELSHYKNSLQRLRENGSAEDIVELEKRVAQIGEAIEQNDFRAANIRAGYVYVISNVGTFGSNVVKIGMTRRLDPMDRVRELGDASVPFPFDVHAIYFSEDAVTLENELHKEFAALRMNQVNLRREFFFATPVEVRDVLRTKVGALLEFAEVPEATQYHQSAGLWPQELQADAEDPGPPRVDSRLT